MAWKLLNSHRVQVAWMSDTKLTCGLATFPCSPAKIESTTAIDRGERMEDFPGGARAVPSQVPEEGRRRAGVRALRPGEATEDVLAGDQFGQRPRPVQGRGLHEEAGADGRLAQVDRQ